MADWQYEVFERILERADEIDRVLRLCTNGLSHVSGAVKAVEAWAVVKSALGEEVNADEHAHRLGTAQRNASFAQSEIDRGFPVLHANATVALWSALEVGIDELVLEFLRHNPDLLSSPAFSNIKIALAEFERLDQSERREYLLSEYKRNCKTDWKLGVSRFESILEVVGLSGAVEDELLIPETN